MVQLQVPTWAGAQDLLIRRNMTIHETTQPERWLTLEEAAAHLNVSLSWIYQKGAKQGLPLCQIGRQYRVRATDLDKWLLENGVKSA